MGVRTILREQYAEMSVDCQATSFTGADVPVDSSLSVSRAQEMAEFFKTLADANRLRLLAALRSEERV